MAMLIYQRVSARYILLKEYLPLMGEGIKFQRVCKQLKWSGIFWEHRKCIDWPWLTSNDPGDDQNWDFTTQNVNNRWISATEILRWRSDIGTCGYWWLYFGQGSNTGIRIFYWIHWLCSPCSNGKHEAVLDQSSGGIIHLFPQGFGSDILRWIGTQSMVLNSWKIQNILHYLVSASLLSPTSPWVPWIIVWDVAIVSLQMAQHHCLKSNVGQLCLGGFLKLRHPQIIQIGAFYSIKNPWFCWSPIRTPPC